MGLIIHTPVGIVVHSGDFKIDYTPVISEATNFNQLASLGAKGVLLLLSDSTYAELPGYTPSERVVSDTLDQDCERGKGEGNRNYIRLSHIPHAASVRCCR